MGYYSSISACDLNSYKHAHGQSGLFPQRMASCWHMWMSLAWHLPSFSILECKYGHLGLIWSTEDHSNFHV